MHQPFIDWNKGDGFQRIVSKSPNQPNFVCCCYCFFLRLSVDRMCSCYWSCGCCFIFGMSSKKIVARANQPNKHSLPHLDLERSVFSKNIYVSIRMYTESTYAKRLAIATNDEISNRMLLFAFRRSHWGRVHEGDTHSEFTGMRIAVCISHRQTRGGD